MVYDSNQWIDKHARRSDITGLLTHLTKPNTNMDAIDILIKILNEKTLLGSTTKSGYIIGNTPAVCFQEAPLYSIAQNCYEEKKKQQADSNYKVKYQPIGLQFHKWTIYSKGGRPALYEESNKAKTILPQREHWRIVDFDLHDKQKLTDWTHEREWRLPGNLAFDYQDVYIVIDNKDSYKRLIQKMDHNILSQIQGITVINQVFS